MLYTIIRKCTHCNFQMIELNINLIIGTTTISVKYEYVVPNCMRMLVLSIYFRNLYNIALYTCHIYLLIRAFKKVIRSKYKYVG